MLAYTATTFFCILSSALAAPNLSRNILSRRSVSNGPVISKDFADPSVIQAPDGTYYAFATSGNGHRVQVAKSPDFVSWTILDQEALPLEPLPPWISAHPGIWAPDVIAKDGGGYLMTYTAPTTDGSHCIGVATSSSPEGPYTNVNDQTPEICPSPDDGGGIDSSYFKDNDGSLYIVYKVDGNSKGKDTPIMIQQVAADGFGTTGFPGPVELLRNGPYDGGIVEAPAMFRVQDTYFLSFSSNSYATDLYDVSYAYATSPTAPFTKSTKPLLLTGDYDLGGPGGADPFIANDGSTKMVFHARLGGPNHTKAPRVMYTAEISVDATKDTITV